jgi:hypothetical protein
VQLKIGKCKCVGNKAEVWEVDASLM